MIKKRLKDSIKYIFNNSLISSSGIYTLSSIISSAIPFFLIPILTRYMSPEEYGIVSMFTILVSITAPFVGFSVQSSIARQYYESDTMDLPSYIGNCFAIFIASLFLISGVFFLFSRQISSITQFPHNKLWLVITVSAFQFIIQIILLLWQVQVKPLYYGIYQILLSALNMSLSVLFVVSLHFSWEGRVYAQLIAFFMLALYGLLILYRNRLINLGINKTYINKAIKYGAPLIPHNIGATVITMMDRIFITNMIGLSSTGIYTVGYQVGNIIGLLQDAFNKAYVPWLFARLKANDGKIKENIVRFTYAYFILVFTLAMCLSYIAPLLLKLFVGKDFVESSRFVLWISLGFCFDGMYKMVANYIYYAQKTHLLAIITFVSATINIILNYILISINGALGAAQATAITFFLVFVLTWILSNRVYVMPWGFFLRNLIRRC